MLGFALLLRLVQACDAFLFPAISAPLLVREREKLVGIASTITCAAVKEVAILVAGSRRQVVCMICFQGCR